MLFDLFIGHVLGVYPAGSPEQTEAAWKKIVVQLNDKLRGFKTPSKYKLNELSLHKKDM
jgi:hypothetical protein